MVALDVGLGGIDQPDPLGLKSRVERGILGRGEHPAPEDAGLGSRLGGFDLPHRALGVTLVDQRLIVDLRK